MRLLGLASIVLAVAALYFLAASEVDALAFYTLLAFACAFIGYCAGSIEGLRQRLHRVERDVARPQAKGAEAHRASD